MKGMIFNPDSIGAIIEGRKTQTRRVIKPQPPKWANSGVMNQFGRWDFGGEGATTHKISCGYVCRYQVGETVYIKEAWAIIKENDNVDICDMSHNSGIYYKLQEYPDVRNIGRWRSPLFMPEWAARYFITITDVRAERVQEITEEDAIKEGFDFTYEKYEPWALIDAKTDFLRTWNSINKDYPWESNPFVWVYRFRLKDKQ